MVGSRQFQAHHMKRVVSACILCLAVAACSRTSPPAPPVAPVPAATPAAPAPGEAATSLFPARDWETDYQFDDGSKEVHEWWVRTPERVVAATALGVYAVWQIRPDGIYRRDPLGGDGAAWLRYLPNPLQDSLVWQQQSGDTTVRFWLRRLPTCDGLGPSEYLTQSNGWRPCWELRIHNRNQVQRFDFVPGKGVVAADVLAPAKPGASFHKVSTTYDALHKPRPERMADWLAAAEASDTSASEAPPVQASTPAAFNAVVQASLQPRLSPLALDSGTPTWMIGSLDAYTPDPLIVLLDSGAEAWYRLGAQCRYRLLTQISPTLLQECKVTPDSRYQGVETYRVAAWYRKGRQLQRYDMPATSGAKRFAVEYDTLAHRVVVPGDGTVQLECQMGDVAGHTRRITLRPTRMTSPKFGDIAKMDEVKVEFAPTGPALNYPAQPADVLKAALQTRSLGLMQELPRYFTDPAVADAFFRADLYRYYDVLQVLVGRLVKNPNASPRVSIQPQPVVAGQSIDFLISGYVGPGIQVLSGHIEFRLGARQEWQIGAVDQTLTAVPENDVGPSLLR